MNNPIEYLGILAVTIMVVSYGLEARHPLFVALFSAGCALAAFYALLIGSYPFLVAEGIWSVVALRRYLRLRQ